MGNLLPSRITLRISATFTLRQPHPSYAILEKRPTSSRASKHRSPESLEDTKRPPWLPWWDGSIDFTISQPKFWYRAGGKAVFCPDIRPDRTLVARGVVFDRIVFVSRAIQRRNVTKNTADWEAEYRIARKPLIDVL